MLHQQRIYVIIIIIIIIIIAVAVYLEVRNTPNNDCSRGSVDNQGSQ